MLQSLLVRFCIVFSLMKFSLRYNWLNSLSCNVRLEFFSLMNALLKLVWLPTSKISTPLKFWKISLAAPSGKPSKIFLPAAIYSNTLVGIAEEKFFPIWAWNYAYTMLTLSTNSIDRLLRLIWIQQFFYISAPPPQSVNKQEIQVFRHS